jgi:hypothetical protein
LKIAAKSFLYGGQLLPARLNRILQGMCDAVTEYLKGMHFKTKSDQALYLRYLQWMKMHEMRSTLFLNMAY